MPRKKPKNVEGQSSFDESAWRQHFATQSNEFDNRGSAHLFDHDDISTQLPGSLSRHQAQSLSQALDRSLEHPNIHDMLGRRGSGSWDIQTPQQILMDVRQHVQNMKPWRPHVEDVDLDKKRSWETQDQDGFFVIMPDNRVRSMENLIGKRVRAKLFDIGEGGSCMSSSATGAQSGGLPNNPSTSTVATVAASKHGKRSQRINDFLPPITEKKPPPQKHRAPWYAHPKTWYSKPESSGEIDALEALKKTHSSYVPEIMQALANAGGGGGPGPGGGPGGGGGGGGAGGRNGGGQSGDAKDAESRPTIAGREHL